MPPAGRNEQQQLRARVKVEALQDNRLIAASVPVRYELDDDDAFVLYKSTGHAYLHHGVTRGSTYTSYSYATRTAPRALEWSLPTHHSSLVQSTLLLTPPAIPP